MVNNLAVVKKTLKNFNIDELKSNLNDYATNTQFECDIWYLDKLRKGNQIDSFLMIHFSNYSTKYTELLKYHVLLELNKRISIGTVKNKLGAIRVFLSHIEDSLKINNLNEINKAVLFSYEKYIYKLTVSNSNKSKKMEHVMEFIVNINQYEGVNIFSNYVNVLLKHAESKTLVKTKYIPKEITNQLDIAFREEQKINLHDKLMYWICRSIPSRISEASSIKINCLQPSFTPNTWVLYIPTWKISGSYIDPELRLIYIIYEGHGKYLIDLIREQQDIANSLQNFVNEDRKGFLFTYINKKRKNNTIDDSNVSVLHGKLVRKHFKQICERYKIINSDGKLYKFTTHQLRHNGITDRVYEGFNLIQIRDMTAHKGDSMIINSYIHIDEDKLIAKQRIVSSKEALKNNPKQVLFRGRIFNMDSKQESILLSNKRALSLGKIGICSDLTHCKNTSLFLCFDECKYFIPDADNLDYFENQLLEWEKKIKIFDKHTYMKEHSLHNYNLYKRIILKINNVIGVINE